MYFSTTGLTGQVIEQGIQDKSDTLRQVFRDHGIESDQVTIEVLPVLPFDGALLVSASGFLPIDFKAKL